MVKNIVIIFCVSVLFYLTTPSNVLAQLTCINDKPDCGDCFAPSTCSVGTPTRSCTYNPAFNTYDCCVGCQSNATPPPGGSCPPECRQAACGVGYSPAGGCSGCNVNQVCCSPNYCGGGGGGGGGCPCGQNWTSICTTPVTCANDYDGNVGGNCGGANAYWCEYYAGCNTCPVCATTQPTNVVVTQNSPTSATVTWTPGTGGNGQAIYIGMNQAAVESDCTLPGCSTWTISLTSTQSSYFTGDVLSAGDIYYFRIVNFNSALANCMSRSATVSSLSSCSLSPTVLSLAPTNTATLTAVVNANALIQRVDFSSSNSSIVSVSPTSDTTYQYQTIATGVNLGSASISATV